MNTDMMQASNMHIDNGSLWRRLIIISLAVSIKFEDGSVTSIQLGLLQH